MGKSSRSHTILMVDDDAEDCLLVKDAFEEACCGHDLRFVRDGEELSDYLSRNGEYQDERFAPRPDLILLDLRMPRRDGRETLRMLKADAATRRIPVVVLTTSTTRDDVDFCYENGVNSYMRKPDSFQELVKLINVLSDYWFELVELPAAR